MEIIKSAAGHNYIYDRNTSYISLSSNYSPKENENQVNPHFAKKLDYLTRHGIISQEKSEDRKSTRLNSSHTAESRMPSSA